MDSTYEKLGAFYLGREHDLATGETSDNRVMYDSKDLTTHGVCVGMTGSGKTGLCLGLIEEAVIDGIPVIAIDPKGDLGNLALTFPNLKPTDFRPWIDEDEAARKGRTPDEHAKATANMWKKGLADWDQDGERIQRLKDAADVTIYTPGSTAGVPITVLKSFDAPPPEVLEDSDAMRDRVQAAVSGLLALVNIHADPVTSREHILLSNILDRAWREGKNLSLPDLIRAIQAPSFDKIGIFDLESFFPEKERFALCMQMNGILASPGFASWLEGDALDVGKLMYSPDGKPKISILSIAHLNDSERMFFVTILLNEVLSWMRTQAGTSSLRAMLYMDEIYGYFPPTANPPSKQPMLTLLKQARAFGLGCVLATQNPVDLDYKGLSNTGTWFIGRLQTERDKMRVLDGLEGASNTVGSDFDRGKMEQILAGLGSRVFLLHNVHEDSPVIFHTRWAMSYLRGPMTREHIKTLMDDKKSARVAAVAATTGTTSASAAEVKKEKPKNERPTLPSAITELFINNTRNPGTDDRVMYRPKIGATLRLRYADTKAKMDKWFTLSLINDVPSDGPFIEWENAKEWHEEKFECDDNPIRDAEFSYLAGDAMAAKNYKAWEKELKSWVYQNRWLTLYKCSELKMVSAPGASEGEFRGQLIHAAREARDLAISKLREKYAYKLKTAGNKIRKAEQKVETQTAQYEAKKRSSFINIGQTILGAVMGRSVVGRAGTTMRGASGASKEKQDIAHALADLDEVKTLEEELRADILEQEEHLANEFDLDRLEITELQVRPRKTDITVYKMGLVWTPWKITSDGIAEPLF